jgi:hypothetical protein
MYRKLVVVSSLPLVLAACSTVQTPPAAFDVPAALRPVPHEKLSLSVAAKGVQIYECRTKTDPTGAYGWAFVAPEADLFGSDGKKVGRHYAGPHWEASDGSKIIGKTRESVPASRTEDIPWLLLTTKSVGPGGSFSDTTSIQRVNTVGGIAPKSGCDQSTVGTTARVPYTADYHFLSGN